MIIELLAYSILDSTYTILMDCGKYHVMHDMTILLSIGRSECQ